MPDIFRILCAAALLPACLNTSAAEVLSGPRIGAIEFIGEVTVASGTPFADTAVGGLSGLDYDPATDRFLALSDDRGIHGAPRFYTLTIDLSDGRLDPGDVTVTGVTLLRDSIGAPLPLGTVDPEAIRFGPDGALLYWSSEGDAALLVPPSVQAMAPDGRQVRAFALPPAYVPNAQQTLGVRVNEAFESLTLGPDEKHLFTAVEAALHQDGPAASVDSGSPARVLRYDLETGAADAAFVYWVEPVPSEPTAANGGAGNNGLVELLALDETTFLALERAYVPGVGNTIRLFETSVRGATNVHGQMSIRFRAVTPMPKTLLLDLAELGITLDNIEGMSFGPTLADGRRTLILVSDDNFNAGKQMTQFLAFALALPTD